MSPAASRLALLYLVLTITFLPFPVSATAQTPQAASAVRISQVYGGGGANSSATYGCDFIELFNSSNEPVELTGWSVQYYDYKWNVFAPGAIKIPAYGYYLVAKSTCTENNRPPVPKPDYSVYDIALGPANGRAALVRNATAITGVTDPDVADFVGYGTSKEYEGSGAVPALSATTSAQRKEGGCQDGDDNKADFDVLTPFARNSSSATHACVTEAAPAVSSVTPANGSAGVALNANFNVAFSEPVAVTGDWFRIECDLRADITPAVATVAGGPASFAIDPNQDLYGDDSCVLTIYADKVKDADTADPPDGLASDFQARFTTAAGACGDPAYLVHDLQGAAGSSPVAGQTRTVEGVVVGDFQGAQKLGGFFMEEEALNRDADAPTSEGLFVSDGGAPLLDVTAGHRVRVTGRVAEQEGATTLTGLTRLLDCGEGELPAPVTAALPPTSPGWWEQVEGMRVTFADALTVAGSDELGVAGQVRAVAGERPMAYTQLNAPDATGYAAFRADLDSRSVVVDDGSDAAYPDPIAYPPPGLSASNTARVGDRIAAGLTAVVDGRDYRLHPTAPPVFLANNARSAAPARDAENVRAVFLSLDDYFTPNNGVYGPRGAGDERELERQRDKLAAALAAMNPDLVAVSGVENDGTGVGSALADLVAALNAATQPGAYAPVEPGERWGSGETTAGLVFRVARVTPVGPPARLDTGAFAQTGGQPNLAAPLAQTFEETTWGERLTVAVNQWRERDACPADGADADQGDGQDCWNASRSAAANELAAWLATDPTGAGDPDVLILGELNAFRLETPVQNLRSAGYTDLIDTFAGAQAVTALWAGMSGYADYALASASLTAQTAAATTWRINAEEPAALDYQTENRSAEQINALYAPDPYRSSDRDPVVVDLSLLPDQSDLAGEYGLAWHTGQGAWRLGSAWGGANDGVLRGAGSWNDGQGEALVSVEGPAGQYACLHAWLDYSDGDAQAGAADSPNGRWDDNEKVIDGLPIQPGKDQEVAFSLPGGVMDSAQTYNMRFRLVPAVDAVAGNCDAGEMANGLAPTGRADGGEVEDWSFNSGPLAVRLAYFAARARGEVVTVTWETVDEVDAVGFDVFSAATQDGPWQRVNAQLIPAKFPGGTNGATYTYAYRATQQARWHRLETLEASGARYGFGPVLTEERRPTAVTLGSSAAQRVGGGWVTSAYLGCLAAAIILWVCLRRRTR